MIPSGYASTEDPPERRAADYLSGMTDRYAVSVAEGLKGDRAFASVGGRQ
jgi:dGTP triphosphohydrolase